MTMFRRSIHVIVVLALLLAACGGSSAGDSTTTAAQETTTTASEDTGSTTATTAAGDDFSAQWDELVAAAQEEGQLVMVLSTNNQASQSPVFQRFGETFGIEIVESAGSTSEMNSRVLAERSQDLYTVDVAVMGTSGMTGFMEPGALVPLEPLLIDPSIQDRSLWFVEDFPWLTTDTERKYVSEYLLRTEPNLMRSFYNSENVTEEEIANLNSWMDFIDDERWHGRLVTANLADESSDGTSTDLARLWIAHGQEFLDRLFNENPPAISPTGNARLIVDGLARGEWDFCFFCDIVTADATAAGEDGLPIVQNRKTFEEGPATDMTGHFGVFDQAPHPAAAQLFVNWILSEEGQTAINELIDPQVSLGVTALRKDVPQGIIPDETWVVVSDPNYVPAIVDEQLIDQAAEEAHAYVQQLIADLGLTPTG